MKNLHAKAPARQESAGPIPDVDRSIAEAKSAGLAVVDCYRCGAPVIWCSAGSRRGARPIAVEVVALGLGNVAIQVDLIAGGGRAPSAAEVGARTRFRLHGPHCATPGSFSGGARSRKVRA